MKIGYINLLERNFEKLKEHFANYVLININDNPYSMCDVVLLDSEILEKEQEIFYNFFNIPILNFNDIKNVNVRKLENSIVEKYLKINEVIEKEEQSIRHSLRIAMYAKDLCDICGLSSDQTNDIYLAALFHDIGKIAISKEIIAKDSKLTDEEYEIIKTHSLLGANLIKKDLNENIYNIIKHHHERENGTGYPDGLIKQTSIGTKIVAIADSFDAMTSYRIYSDSKSIDEALNELVLCSTSIENGGKGNFYDPYLVSNFVKVFK